MRSMKVAAMALVVGTCAAALLAEGDGVANLPAQPIGVNDLLSIAVYGAPELTRTVRVGEDGLIRMPMVSRKIAALGLMPAALETSIATALMDAEILIDPAVTVTIAEYRGRPVSVAGAVKAPLTFQVTNKITLLEALTRAQGLTETAGAEILVTYPAQDAAPARVKRILVKGLIDAADPALNVTLEGGEEVRVPEIGRVFVMGNVRRSGAFRLDDSAAMTVLKALAMAEGLAPFAGKMAYIYRKPEGPDSGRVDDPRSEVAVELRKIMDRKSPDVLLGTNDILYIPDNRSGRVAATAIERALGFASGALILGVNR